MHDNNRPNPDALLEAMKNEESKAQRGKLKIFFGMSAGVGKTYAMLEEARQLLTEHLDAVIGIVETHHRAETEALVAGIPLIPRKKIEYRGTVLEEMDVDAILARKPQLVLVDELAHSNAPGSRHPKRYLDVLDLLAAGINVFTTVNVQHLESRADAVHQITGIPVRETVPDLLIDIANKIELIDIEPEELLKRLTEGKVYAPERAELASHNFFREGNLTALREMALRITAERVDQQMQDYMQVKQIQGPWKSVERLMVAVSPSPFSERLIRWTRRMAYNLKAQWIAVYVEPLVPLSEAQKAQLSRNLTLVHKLDGEVITTAGEDAVAELLRVARQRNVTQIVIGKPALTWYQDVLAGGSLVNRLIRDSGDIDVYVVTGDKVASGGQRLITPPKLHSGVSKYLIALAVVLGAVAVGYTLFPAIGFEDVALMLLFVILLLASYVGRGPVLMSALLSAVLLDYYFIPPRFSLYVASFREGLILALYILIALVVGNLTARLRSQMKVIHLREERFSALYTMAHEVAHAVTLDDVLRTAVEQIGEIFDAQIAILLPDSAGRLANKAHPVSTLDLDQKEQSVAAWAFEHSQPAGRYTDTLPTSSAQYLPLVTPGGVAGIIGVQMRQPEPPSAEQEALLQTFVSHIALAVERELLNEASQRAAVAAESEKMYTTLLDSVSDELQVPLTTIDETTHQLLDVCAAERSDSQAALVKNLQLSLRQLKGAIRDLLDMNRLEMGRVKSHVNLHDVADLVESSLKKVEKELANRDLVVDVTPNLPPVPMDFALMRQVLVNLLHNAVTYTAPGIRIRITAKIESQQLVLSVADRGPGIPPQDISRVFDKFYRAPGSPPGTSGLGLSIAKGLVEAQGGTISAENRPTHGGARFTIRLPLHSRLIDEANPGQTARQVEGIA